MDMQEIRAYCRFYLRDWNTSMGIFDKMERVIVLTKLHIVIEAKIVAN
ncbi:hypothetical protein [Paenibacillus aceti]|nr:hypothetical protein [Paenibacillus aceti]